MNYNILILDDDKTILEWLSSKIHELFNNVNTVCFDSYEDFINHYDEVDYNIVISDIIFGKTNSIKVYPKITKDGKVPLIYMSGNDTRTFDVYDTPHIYFLAKPIDEERLKKAIDRAMDSKKVLSFDYYKKSYYVDFKDIIYLESDKRIIHIVTKNNIYQTYGKLDDYVSRVPSNFIRLSKSYIVNKNYIKENDSQSVILSNGEKISISRSLKKEIKNVL